MNISIGFDHGALSLRQALIQHLESQGHSLIDHGTDTDSSVDYPDFARPVTADVVSGGADIGVLCCTTGIGMSIAANKVKGIRAALVHHEDEAALTRQHNNANVICFGALHTTADEAIKLVDVFIGAEFEGGRHGRRVDKFSEWENLSCC